MRKKDQKKFLEELSKTPIVSAVCESLSISRQTIYQWIKKDPEFKEKFEEARSRGVDRVNDLSESELIKQIRKGNMRGIEFWLRNNKSNYRQPKPLFYGDIAHSELDKHRDAIIELIEFKRKEYRPDLSSDAAKREYYARYSTDELIKMLRDAEEEK